MDVTDTEPSVKVVQIDGLVSCIYIFWGNKNLLINYARHDMK